MKRELAGRLQQIHINLQSLSCKFFSDLSCLSITASIDYGYNKSAWNARPTLKDSRVEEVRLPLLVIRTSVDGSGGLDRPLVNPESCIEQNLFDGQRGHEAHDISEVAARVHQKPLLEHAPPETVSQGLRWFPGFL